MPYLNELVSVSEVVIDYAKCLKSYHTKFGYDRLDRARMLLALSNVHLLCYWYLLYTFSVHIVLIALTECIRPML